ncbi:MAG: hypothetical protein K6F60_06280 [Eubacterium sp.]|nr:hypothetical protein [Eubacterium sp.]
MEDKKYLDKLYIYYMNAKSLEDMQSLPALLPFDDRAVDFLSELSSAIRKDSVAKSMPVLQTFAFFIRKANLLQMKEEHSITDRIGKGVSLHIAPSNVPINFAYSMVSALLAGNPCIVRASSKDFDETKIICRLIKEVQESIQNTVQDKDANEGRFADIFSYMAVISYPHDKEITDYLSSFVNVRVIWGGDNTIAEIRKSPIRPRCTEVCFADRYSLLFVDAKFFVSQADGSDEEPRTKYLETMAKQFFNDTYLFDQNACGSPRLIYWYGETSDIEKAKPLFWTAIHGYLIDNYEVQPVIAVDKTTMAYKVAAEIDDSRIVPSEDNIITRVEIDDFNQLPSGKTLADFEAPGGFFLEYSSDSLDGLKEIVDERFQTMTFVCDEDNAKTLKDYIVSNGLKGVDRIVPIGHSADFGLVWDGYDLIDSFTRRIV